MVHFYPFFAVVKILAGRVPFCFLATQFLVAVPLGAVPTRGAGGMLCALSVIAQAFRELSCTRGEHRVTPGGS